MSGIDHYDKSSSGDEFFLPGTWIVRRNNFRTPVGSTHCLPKHGGLAAIKEVSVKSGTVSLLIQGMMTRSYPKANSRSGAVTCPVALRVTIGLQTVRVQPSREALH